MRGQHDAKNYPTYARQVPDKQAIKDEMGTEAHPEGVFFLLERLKDFYGNNDMSEWMELHLNCNM